MQPDAMQNERLTSEEQAKLKAIRKQLVEISLVHTPSDLSNEQKHEIRASLLWLNDQSEYQTLGICAASLSEAETALKSYVSALSQPIQVDLPYDGLQKTGAVFIKFNTLKNAWYLDSYSGNSRGVLVTYHATEPGLEDVNGTYGPFPLDLF